MAEKTIFDELELYGFEVVACISNVELRRKSDGAIVLVLDDTSPEAFHQACTAFIAGLLLGIAEEREECAKLCEELGSGGVGFSTALCMNAYEDAADKIRARA